MGTVIVAWNSQLSRTKKGKLKFTGTDSSGVLAGITPAGASVPTRFPPPVLKRVGGVKLLRRVYLPTAESLGRNAAHASSTRAAAPRMLSMEAFACQLVLAARAPACSAVSPPGWTRNSSSGMGMGVVSLGVCGGAGGGGA